MATIIRQERKNGVNFRIQVATRNPGTGKRETKTATYEPPNGLTERELQREVQKFALAFEEKWKQVQKLQSALDDNITVKEYSEVFLESVKQNCSLSYYSSCCHNFIEINDRLGNYRLKDLTPLIIERFRDYLKKKELSITYAVPKATFAQLMTEQKISCNRLSVLAGLSSTTVKFACQGKHIAKDSAKKMAAALGVKTEQVFEVVTKTQKYAAETIAKCFRALKAMLSMAKRQTIITENYAKAEYVKGIKQERRSIKCMNLQQATHLLNCIKTETDIKAKTAIMIIMLMGIRRGECAGLEWIDIDFDEGTMAIERSYTNVSGHGTVTGKPKSENSRRLIDMPPSLTAQLREYRKWWLDLVEQLGDKYTGSNRLFLQDKGTPIYPTTILYWLRKMTEKYGLPNVYVHSLRHTNISIQLTSGAISEKEVAARAGHGSTKVTKDIYWELFKSDGKRAAKSIDTLFGMATESAQQ